MKLSLIVVAMIAATWLAVGDSPRVRSMEQRVSELEQIVVLQSQQLAAQQSEIDRFAPLADVMEVYTSPAGWKTLYVNMDTVFEGGLQANKWLSVIGNLYLFGEFVDNGN